MCRVCLILLVTWLCRGTRICRACSLCSPRFQTTLPSRRCFVLQVSNQALHPTPCTAHAMTATILVTVPLPLLPQHASTATPTTVWRLRRRLSPPATVRRLTLKVRCTAECGADRATVGARARVVGMPRRVPPPEAVYVSLWPRECPGLLNTDGGCATDHHGSEANAGVCTSQNASPWYRGGRDAHLTNQYVPPRRDNRLLWGFTLALRCSHGDSHHHDEDRAARWLVVNSGGLGPFRSASWLPNHAEERRYGRKCGLPGCQRGRAS